MQQAVTEAFGVAAGDSVRDTRDDPLTIQVRAEQVRMIYRQIPFFVAGSHFGVVVTVVFFWGRVPTLPALVWAALLILQYNGYLLMRRSFQRASPGDEDVVAWGRPFVLLGWTATATWGAAAFVFFMPDSLAYQLILVICLTIGAAAVMATTTIYSPAFYPVIMLLAPLSLQLVMQGGVPQQLMSGGLWVYLTLLFFLHRNANRAYVRSQVLSVENMALARQLQEQKDIVEEASEAKSRFLALASHDLRQPLHALGLFVAELRARIDSPAECQPVMKRMDASIETMNNFFGALLDISKLEAGSIEPRVQDFPIDDLLAALELEYRSRAREHGLEFRMVPCSLQVRSDPVLLHRIVGNLLENAVRYTPQGRVLLGCRRKAGRVRIEVWDSGAGIPEADQERIFQEFQQLAGDSLGRGKGLGLGLAVVRQLSGLLGHRIEVRSVAGRGSVFSLEVPATKRARHCPLQPKKEKVPAVHDRLAGARLLVVDDDRAVLDSMQGLLAAWGCEVRTAADAEAAVGEVDANGFRPDIIIADFCIPDRGDGLRVLEQVQTRLGSEVAAVIISADTSSEGRAALEEGGVPFLYKPVEPARLATLLRFLLSQRG